MTGVALVVEDPKWRSHRGLARRLSNAADTARKAAKLRGSFTILLTGDGRMRRLNRDFRGKDKPTNVLSFPAAVPGRDRYDKACDAADGLYRGDIAVGYGTAKREASAQGKAFADHAVHLIVHGVLHLAGYDHERAQDARRMEPLEIGILSHLGICDPYAAQPQ